MSGQEGLRKRRVGRVHVINLKSCKSVESHEYPLITAKLGRRMAVAPRRFGPNDTFLRLAAEGAHLIAAAEVRKITD